MEKEKLILINLSDTNDILVMTENNSNGHIIRDNYYTISVEEVIGIGKIEIEYFIDFKKCIDNCCFRTISETDIKVLNKILRYLKYSEEPKFKKYIFEDKRVNKETRGQICMNLDITYCS